MEYRTTGYTLPRSEKFTKLLPRDGHTDFSAMVYQTLATALGPIADQIAALTSRAAQLACRAGPSLVLAYGAQDRIEFASAGTFFGLRLEQLLGLGAPARRRAAKAPACAAGAVQILMDTKPVIELENLTGPVWQPDHSRQPEWLALRASHRAFGAERRGQVHAHQHAARASTRPPAERRASSAMTCARDVRRVRALVGYMPENDSFIAGMSAVALRALHGGAVRAAFRRRRSNARTRRCSTSAWARRATASWRSTRSA